MAVDIDIGRMDLQGMGARGKTGTGTARLGCK
jgi:hypothetical protein